MTEIISRDEFDYTLDELTDKLSSMAKRLRALETLGHVKLGGGGGGAPANALYLVLAAHAALINERVFVDGDGIVGVDGGAGGNYVLNVGAGYAMAVAADVLNMAWDTVLLHHGGIITGEYATLALAIAAAAAHDTLFVPSGTWTDSVTIPANVTVHGLSQADTVLSGQITLSDGAHIENLTINRSLDEVGAIYGLVEGVGDITATLTNVTVNVANATGPAYAIYMANGGLITAKNVTLLAETGSVGYSVYIVSGDFVHLGGVARGTVALTPYFT